MSMIETQCLVNGKTFKLKYRRQFEKGEVFKGIILSRSAIPFSFQALNENLILFEPQSLDEQFKVAIFKAILKDQLVSKTKD